MKPSLLQAGELPNLRWQISVLVANIERQNNESAGNAQSAAQLAQEPARSHDHQAAPLAEALKPHAASGVAGTVSPHSLPAEAPFA